MSADVWDRSVGCAGIIAGGERAMFRSVEGAEDSAEEGAAAMDGENVGPGDVVLGIAAGGTTPFVHGALRRAGELKARTIFLCCVEKTETEPPADVVIRPLTGPEVLTGSTRLKAGTATKLVLNQITTLAMVRMGKVYENLMVDLRATNQKLWDRGANRGNADGIAARGGDVAVAVHRRRGKDGGRDAQTRDECERGAGDARQGRWVFAERAEAGKLAPGDSPGAKWVTNVVFVCRIHRRSIGSTLRPNGPR